MSGNVDVGGVSAELALGFRDWVRGLESAMGALSTFAGEVDRKFAGVDRAATGAEKAVTGAAGRMRDARGRFVAAGQALRDTARGADRTTEAFGRLGDASHRTSEQVKRDVREMAGAVQEGAGHLRTAGQWMVGLGAAMQAGLGGVAVAALKAADQMEGFEVQLRTLTGSAEAARHKLEFFQNFAVKSSFELKELDEAGVMLENYGRRAEKWLPRIADLAAAKNRSVEPISEMVGKASAGNPEGWEQLRNIGVNGRLLQKFGATLTREGNVDPNAEGNLEALARYLDTLEGADLKRAETIGGRWSMVFDALGKTLAKVGREIAPVAKQVADGLTKAINVVGDLPPGVLKWGGILAGIASGLAVVAGAGLMAAPILVGIGSAVATVGSALATLWPVLVPAGAALAALTAAVATAAVAWARDWGGIQETVQKAVRWIQDNWTALRMTAADVFDAIRDRIVPVWTRLWDSVSETWDRFVDHFRPDFERFTAWARDRWGDMLDRMAQAVAEGVPQVLLGLELVASYLAEWAEKVRVVFTVAFETVRTYLGLMTEGFTTFGGFLGQVGEAVGQFHDRISSGQVRGSLREFAVSVAEAAGEASVKVDDFTRRSSDSLKGLEDVWRQAGEDWAIAVEEGLRGRESALVRASREIGQAMVEGMAPWQRALQGMFGARQAQAGGLDKFRASILQAGEADDPAAGLAALVPLQARLAAMRQAEQGKGAGADQVLVREINGLVQELVRVRNALRRERDAAPEEGSGGGEDGKKGKGRKLSAAELVVREASGRVGESFRAGVAAQCANFIYDVYERAGIKLRAASRPLDQGPGGNEALANSFFSPEVGEIITDSGKLKPGDILGFRNTYGAFEKDAITHAGIYVGGGMMVDRGTSDAPVHRRSAMATFPGHFAYAVRPYQLTGKAGASEDDLARNRETVAAFLAKSESPFDQRRVAIEKEYRQAVDAATRAGATDQLPKLEAEYKTLLASLEADRLEHERKLAQEMERERAEAFGSETMQARLALQQQFEDKVAHWETLAREEPARAQEAQEQIALLRQGYAMQSADLEKRLQEEQAARVLEFNRKQWQDRFQTELEGHQFAVQMGQETNDQLLAFLAQQLDAWQGTEDQKRALMVQYRDLYAQQIQQQLEMDGEFNTARLEQLLEQAEAEESIEADHVARVAALRQLLRDQQMADMQQAQQVFAQVEQSIQQFLVQTLSGQQNFNQTFANLWKSIVNTIITEITKALLKLLAFQKILGGILSMFGGPAGGAVGTALGSLAGNVQVLSGAPAILHDGGPVGHFPGIRFDEVAAVLQAGEVVVPRAGVRRAARALDEAGRPGRGGYGGPSFTNNYHIAELVVREEADIHRIAAELFRMQRADQQGRW